MNIPPVCNGDTIEININIYSKKGLINTKEIKWLNVETLPFAQINYMNFKSNLYEIDKKAKIISDLNRICEIEDSVTDWQSTEYKNSLTRKMFKLEMLEKNFTVVSMVTAKMDQLISKVELKATKIGVIDTNILGIKIIIQAKQVSVSVEIKRLGFIMDRKCPIELRVGDILILFLSNNPC